MSSKREEKERLRAERLAAQQAAAGSARRRLVGGYVLAGLLTAAVIAGIVAVAMSGGDGGGGDDTSTSACAEAHVQADTGTTNGVEFDCREGTPPPPIAVGDLKIAARDANCDLQENLKDEGNSHVANTKPVTYKTNPPTSGDHNPNPAADGAYATPLADQTAEHTNVRNFVHALEHGRVEIHYSPDLPEEDQLALKGVFDEDPDGMLLLPNPSMPYKVAVTGWTALVGCPEYSPTVIDVVRDFRDTYRGNGPEDIPISF